MQDWKVTDQMTGLEKMVQSTGLSFAQSQCFSSFAIWPSFSSPAFSPSPTTSSLLKTSHVCPWRHACSSSNWRNTSPLWHVLYKQSLESDSTACTNYRKTRRKKQTKCNMKTEHLNTVAITKHRQPTEPLQAHEKADEEIAAITDWCLDVFTDHNMHQGKQTAYCKCSLFTPCIHTISSQ